MDERIEDLYVRTLEFKNTWEASFAEALKIEDTLEAINTLDELKTNRDLFIRQARRILKNSQARITHTNTALLAPVELLEHNESARRFELTADEIERVLEQWSAEQVMPEGIE